MKKFITLIFLVALSCQIGSVNAQKSNSPSPVRRIGENESVRLSVSSEIDIQGAIKFAEDFLEAAYFDDIDKMKTMICKHPDVQSWWTDDTYKYALKRTKKEGMRLNLTRSIYSKCDGIYDLDITTFDGVEEIPGYYKVNVHFDADTNQDDAEFVSLRVMVFQNETDHSFSIFSIK